MESDYLWRGGAGGRALLLCLTNIVELNKPAAGINKENKNKHSFQKDTKIQKNNPDTFFSSIDFLVLSRHHPKLTAAMKEK